MKINLLPWRTTQQQQQKKIFFLLLLGTVMGAVICIGLAQHNIAKKIIMQKSLSLQLQNQLTQQEQNYQQKKLLWQQQQQLQQNTQTLIVLENRQKQIETLLKILPNLLPSDAHLTKLELAPKTILLLGQTNNPIAVTTLLNNLEKITWLSTPQLLNSQPISNKKNGVTFQIKTDFKESLE